jgi:deazaflavin-dependent oxidoreductase (nitroreductase family)
MADIEMASRMRRRARLMRIINVLMRRLLALPFPTPLGRQLMLLTITGRKSGRIYRQPVSYVRDGDTLLTPGGGKWTLNLREDQAVPIRLNGHDRHGRPELITDPSLITELLHTMAASNPRITRFVPVIAADRTIDPTRLNTAVQHGFCIVRWHEPPAQPLPTVPDRAEAPGARPWR